MTRVDEARRYERAYHERVYREHEVDEPGSWLHQPSGYVLGAFTLIPDSPNPAGLDLGAGPGRHGIRLAQYLGPRSSVICVDQLPSAIDKLESNATRFGVDDRILGVVGDVADFDLEGLTFDFVLSGTCIEHVPDKETLEALIRRLQEHTNPGGVHCFLLMTDNEWHDLDDGSVEEPLLEQNLSSAEAIEMLRRLYADWTIHDISTQAWSNPQAVEGRNITLNSTGVHFTAQKPATI